jgi:tetratricopeptide (TPR) repeat protein
MKRIIPVVLFLSCLFVTSKAVPNQAAWMALMDNKLSEAKSAFEKASSDKNPVMAADACMGLAHYFLYIGNTIRASAWFYKGALIENDPNVLAAAKNFNIIFARENGGSTISDGYKALELAAKKGGFFSGLFNDELINRLGADGKFGDADDKIRSLGCITHWKCIGPFDNTSESGYDQAFSPEHEIDFSKDYSAKNGNMARWFNIDVHNHSCWLFMENHSTALNSVYYFYTIVNSPKETDGLLSFGASAAFKIWFNGKRACVDSVFRNTGIDSYLRKVHLIKGKNVLIIKLCNESANHITGQKGYANFAIRFMDYKGSALAGLTTSTEQVPVGPLQNSLEADYFPSPLDSLKALFAKRLAVDSTDFLTALRLMHLFIMEERTNDAEKLASSYVIRCPQSGIWHELYGEALIRGKKYTRGQIELKKSYALCPTGYLGWTAELNNLKENGTGQAVLNFLAKSPDEMKDNELSHIARFSALAIQKDISDAMKEITVLEKDHADKSTTVTMLIAIYAKQGLIDKAENLADRYLEHDHCNAKLYRSMYEVMLNRGDAGKAMSWLDRLYKAVPDDPNGPYLRARLFYNLKKYPRALEEIKRCVQSLPDNGEARTFMGNVCMSMNDPAGARAAFTDAIKYSDDDFNAWDNLRLLDGKKAYASSVDLPSVDSLQKQTKAWKSINYEKGAILAYYTDQFYYPSHCAEKRTFVCIHVPTQKAIDIWKEVDLSRNPHYQTLSINRAVSVGPSGEETPADINETQIVFKALKPGDCIVYEFIIRDYFSGEMAPHVYGNEEFLLSYPIWDRKVRLITGQNDSIESRAFGDSVSSRTYTVSDLRVKEYSHPPTIAYPEEKYGALQWKSMPCVAYSTISDWNFVANWYRRLTAQKRSLAPDIMRTVDSLLVGCVTSPQKIRALHEYITQNIRYSSVSFRQSGWIPQSINEISASRIGDCKDMSLFAMSMLEYAGIPSSLVLVNTGLRYADGQAMPSPDFNHCIVSYLYEGKRRYMDCTDQNLAFPYIPLMDQGAFALVIDTSTRGPVILPIDSLGNRVSSRKVSSSIDTGGLLTERVETVRSGIIASGFRKSYRFVDKQERFDKLKKSLSEDYSEILVDSFELRDDSVHVTDSLLYSYTYRAPRAVQINGTTCIFPLNIPDAFSAEAVPSEDPRLRPIDMVYNFQSAGTYLSSGTLSFPTSWKPLSIPEKAVISGPYGKYSLAFELKQNKLSWKRTYEGTIRSLIPLTEFAQFRQYFLNVSKADKVQLVFTKK